MNGRGDDAQFWNVRYESAETDVIMIDIGGQEGGYRARQVVDEEQASCRRGTSRARCFLESGRWDAALTWELHD